MEFANNGEDRLPGKKQCMCLTQEFENGDKISHGISEIP